MISILLNPWDNFRRLSILKIFSHCLRNCCGYVLNALSNVLWFSAKQSWMSFVRFIPRSFMVIISCKNRELIFLCLLRLCRLSSHPLKWWLPSALLFCQHKVLSFPMDLTLQNLVCHFFFVTYLHYAPQDVYEFIKSCS